MKLTADSTFTSKAILAEAKRVALTQAFLRPESAIIVVLSVLMAALCMTKIFWAPALWWAWLLFGLAGLGAIVLLSMRDFKFFQPIVLKIFHQRLDRNHLRMPELKNNVDHALSSHRALFDEITRHPNAPLSGVAADSDQLVLGIYRAALSVDSFVADDHIRMFLTSLIDMPSANASDDDNGIIDSGEAPRDIYAGAIVPHNEVKGVRGSPESKEEMLTHVLHALNGTRDDLQDAISNIAFARDRIANHDAASDWTFVEELRQLFTEQLQGLDRRKGALDRLKYSCEMAMMRA